MNKLPEEDNRGMKLTLINGSVISFKEDDMLEAEDSYTITKKFNDSDRVKWETYITIPKTSVLKLEAFRKIGGENM